MMLPSADTLTRELSDLRRRISDLESSRRLGNSSISEGALIARDAAGVEQARFGQLPDGTYGVTGRIASTLALGDTAFQMVSLTTSASFEQKRIAVPLAPTFHSFSGKAIFLVAIGLTISADDGLQAGREAYANAAVANLNGDTQSIAQGAAVRTGSVGSASGVSTAFMALTPGDYKLDVTGWLTASARTPPTTVYVSVDVSGWVIPQ